MRTQRFKGYLGVVSGTLIVAVAVGSQAEFANSEGTEPKAFASGLYIAIASGLKLRIGEDQRPLVRGNRERQAHPWACRKEEKGWLFYTGMARKGKIPFGEPAGMFGYLAFRTSVPEKDADSPDKPAPSLVIMSETIEPNCYWDIEDNDRDPRKGWRSHFHLKPSIGDYKGWYLDRGEKFDERNWSVTLIREKPDGWNKMSEEGP